MQHTNGKLGVQRRTAQERITAKLERAEAELARREEREQRRREVSEKFLGLAIDTVDDATLEMLANAEIVQTEDEADTLVRVPQHVADAINHTGAEK